MFGIYLEIGQWKFTPLSGPTRQILKARSMPNTVGWKPRPRFGGSEGGGVGLGVGEEGVEGAVQGVVVIGEVADTVGDGGEAGGAGGDAAEGEVDAGDGAVGFEPAFLAHAGLDAAEVVAEPVGVALEGVVEV